MGAESAVGGIRRREVLGGLLVAGMLPSKARSAETENGASSERLERGKILTKHNMNMFVSAIDRLRTLLETHEPILLRTYANTMEMKTELFSLLQALFALKDNLSSLHARFQTYLSNIDSTQSLAVLQSESIVLTGGFFRLADGYNRMDGAIRNFIRKYKITIA